jgi:hypothetical protein
MKKYFLSITLVIIGLVAGPSVVDATGFDAPLELDGYAWSPTIGWISMNCSNSNSCVGGTAAGPKVNYNVQIETDGRVTGYAWSPHIGWVRFGGLSGFPSGPGTVSQSARANGVFPNLTFAGWARACSAAANVTSCSGGSNSSAGGWDGWISLGGTQHSIRTNVSGVVANSYAWGSMNVGWVDFNPVTFGAIPPVTLTLAADPTELTYKLNDTSAVLTYNVTNAVGGCTASNNNGDSEWTSSRSLAVTPGNKQITVEPRLGVTTYTLTCTNVDTPVTRTVQVVARPDLKIANPTVEKGTVNNLGYYPSVLVKFSLMELPNGVSNVPYRVTLGGTEVGGTVNGTGGVITVVAQFTDVPFGDNIPYTIAVDHLTTPNTYGVVQEDITSTTADEDDNTYNNTVTLPPPEPIIEIGCPGCQPSGLTSGITVPTIIQSGDMVTFDMSTTAPYVVTCTVQGPGGITESVTTNGSIGSPDTATKTVGPSAPLYNTTIFEITCNIGGDPEDYRVEVIPTVEEV